MSTELTTPIKIEIPCIGTIESSDLYLKFEVDAAITELKAENRKAKRALWTYRAMIAKKLKKSFGIMALYNPLLSTEEHKWEVVERKCRTKAEEYK